MLSLRIRRPSRPSLPASPRRHGLPQASTPQPNRYSATMGGIRWFFSSSLVLAGARAGKGRPTPTRQPTPRRRPPRPQRDASGVEIENIDATQEDLHPDFQNYEEPEPESEKSEKRLRFHSTKQKSPSRPLDDDLPSTLPTSKSKKSLESKKKEGSAKSQDDGPIVPLDTTKVQIFGVEDDIPDEAGGEAEDKNKVLRFSKRSLTEKERQRIEAFRLDDDSIQGDKEPNAQSPAPRTEEPRDRGQGRPSPARGRDVTDLVLKQRSNLAAAKPYSIRAKPKAAKLEAKSPPAPARGRPKSSAPSAASPAASKAKASSAKTKTTKSSKTTATADTPQPARAPPGRRPKLEVPAKTRPAQPNRRGPQPKRGAKRKKKAPVLSAAAQKRLETRRLKTAVHKIANSLGIGDEHLDLWYKVSPMQLSASLLDYPALRSDLNLAEALEKAYPTHPWEPWRLLTPLPSNYWKNRHNQRRFLYRLGITLGFRKVADWYSLTTRDILENGGKELLALHKNSLLDILRAGFPRYRWQPWRLAHGQRNWWATGDHRRLFLQWLVKSKKLRASKSSRNKLDALYSLTYADIASNGGSKLFKENGNSVFQVLKGAYPKHKWHPWRFEEIPSGNWWKEEGNEAVFVEWLAKRKRLRGLDGLYALTIRDFTDNGGGALLSSYRSLPDLLGQLYPHHDWMPWKFATAKKQWWQQESNYSLFVDWIKAKRKFTSPSDFSALSPTFLKAIGAEYVLNERSKLDSFAAKGGVVDPNIGASALGFLERVFPDHHWDPTIIPRANSTRIQLAITRAIKLLRVPRVQVIGEYWQLPVRYRQSGTPMMLQYYVPETKTALEFRPAGGAFFDSYGDGPLFQQYVDRQEELAATCALNGIALIEIPEWWTGEFGLRPTIKRTQPDFFTVAKQRPTRERPSAKKVGAVVSEAKPAKMDQGRKKKARMRRGSSREFAVDLKRLRDSIRRTEARKMKQTPNTPKKKSQSGAPKAKRESKTKEMADLPNALDISF